MHETAATAASVGPTIIILIGILLGILYNQRRIDRLEARMDRPESRLEGWLDKMQADLHAFHRSLGQHDKAIEVLEKRAS